MRKLETTLVKSNLDPCVRLWAAVIKRAYLDAIGKITDLYGGCGKEWWTESAKTQNKYRLERQKAEIQKEAIKFLKENKWIFTITNISQEFTIKLVEENYQKIL